MDHLDRLFHRLVNNIRSRNPAHLTLPFTVAELYEQIVPYRHNRRELGIETNQDYEVTVTRLLSGERGYLLGDESMQESLRRELESHDPDVSAFREFPTAEVSISPSALQSVGAAPRRPAQAAEAETSAAAASAQQASGNRESPAESVRARQTDSPSDESVTAPAARASSSSRIPREAFSPDAGCRFCGATLPEGKQVKFCPNCGQNLSINRCPACGSEIEAGWKFCITCGRAAGV
ncbi:hypothetical protein BH23GEM2_BH23GEM2_23830 [soil metagenome]